MKIRINLYLITAILLTSNFLTLCEGDNDIDHEPFSDHVDHLDDLDDFHDINNFDDNNVMHTVELVQHNGDLMTKYATSHINQEKNNELFPNTIPIIQQSNVPTTFTKVVKQTVIKQSNNDGSNAPKTDLLMKDIYSNNKLKENVIGNVENIGLLSTPSQQASDLQGNIKNVIHTTVTKTTTSGSPLNELNESYNRIHNLNILPSNNIISTMNSANTNYNDRISGSNSLQSNSMDENSKIKTISTTGDIIDENGFDNSKRIPRIPVGSFRRMKTTIIKQNNMNDINNLGDLSESTIGFNKEDTSSNNIVSSMTTPLEYNTVTTTTVDGDNNVFNKGIPSWRQQKRLNKFNTVGNSISETGPLQNPGSFVQTKTTIIKNERAADEIKLDDLNDNKIDYNIDDRMATSNNFAKSNYIISSDNNDSDKGNGYSYSYGYGNGMDSSNYNKMYNGNIISSNHLMDGASSDGYSSYMISNGYSKGNGKRKKRKKNGRTKKYKGGSSKNSSYGKSKGNGQIKIKKGRNYENKRSSKSRNGKNSKYYSSTNYVKGVQSKSSSSSESSSNESSLKKKKSCYCDEERKLNKRDSSEKNGSCHSKEHHGSGSHDLGNSMENQPMQNNGNFITGFPPPLPTPIGRTLQPNLLFDMMQGQEPDQSLKYNQSNIIQILNGLGEKRSQLINNNQLPNIDKSNQYLTYQIPNTGLLYKPDSQKEQYFGSTGLGRGPPTNPFDSRPFIGGEYPKYFEQNLQPPPLSQSPYTFNQDYYPDFSKMGFTNPAFTDIQSAQDNQININTNFPQMQQDIEGTGFNRMDELNSGSMATLTRSKFIRNIDNDPIIQYFKTIKTTENIDENDPPDMQKVQTQTVLPEVDGYGIPYISKLLQTVLDLVLQIFPGLVFLA